MGTAERRGEDFCSFGLIVVYTWDPFEKQTHKIKLPDHHFHITWEPKREATSFSVQQNTPDVKAVIRRDERLEKRSSGKT